MIRVFLLGLLALPLSVALGVGLATGAYLAVTWAFVALGM